MKEGKTKASKPDEGTGQERKKELQAGKYDGNLRTQAQKGVGGTKGMKEGKYTEADVFGSHTKFTFCQPRATRHEADASPAQGDAHGRSFVALLFIQCVQQRGIHVLPNLSRFAYLWDTARHCLSRGRKIGQP